MTTLTMRIKGYDLPGLEFCASAPGGATRQQIHVGIQRGREVVGLVPGDAASALFEFEIDVVQGRNGGLDFRGAFVHGRPGERSLYLSWMEREPNGQFTMFRRAKLHLNTIASDDLQRACDTAGVLEAHLPLTDRRGGPICAAVRPPTLCWHLAAV